MKTKQVLLDEIRSGLRAGIITKADLTAIVKQSTTEAPKVADKTTAVDVMFYIAGVVLYSAMLSVISQSWESGIAFVHILLSAGFGVALWAYAYDLILSPVQSDIRTGLTNALLLTGSLAVTTGGFIITSKIMGGPDEMTFLSSALTLAALGAVHIGFDALVRKNFILLMGILLSVAVFPTILFGFLRDADAPRDIWFAVLIASAGLLAATTRVVANVKQGRQAARGAFDSLAAFIALGAMYGASLGAYGLLWSMALILSVFSLFYLSIKSQNKHLLGSGSFFLVVMVITMSFRYFSGFGATASLVVAAVGLLATAAIASSINKKYFN